MAKRSKGRAGAGPGAGAAGKAGKAQVRTPVEVARASAAADAGRAVTAKGGASKPAAKGGQAGAAPPRVKPPVQKPGARGVRGQSRRSDVPGSDAAPAAATAQTSAKDAPSRPRRKGDADVERAVPGRRAAGASASRASAREERRQAILSAALGVFAAEGFAAARLDDVAKGAGVAKGTLYLYFPDKQSLFQGLVEEMITPVLVDADALVPLFPGTTRDLLDALMDMMVERILDAPAQAILRLMLSEGPRFPELAAYYYREVISRGVALLRQVGQRALDRGEIASDAAVRFPQLIIAPALVAVVWNAMFGAFDPLDPRALLSAHRDLLLKGLGWTGPEEPVG